MTTFKIEYTPHRRVESFQYYCSLDWSRIDFAFCSESANCCAMGESVFVCVYISHSRYLYFVVWILMDRAEFVEGWWWWEHIYGYHNSQGYLHTWVYTHMYIHVCTCMYMNLGVRCVRMIKLIKFKLLVVEWLSLFKTFLGRSGWDCLSRGSKWCSFGCVGRGDDNNLDTFIGIGFSAAALESLYLLTPPPPPPRLMWIGSVCGLVVEM